MDQVDACNPALDAHIQSPPASKDGPTRLAACAHIHTRPYIRTHTHTHARTHAHIHAITHVCMDDMLRMTQSTGPNSGVGTKPHGVGTKPRGVGTKPRGVGTKPHGVGTKPHGVGTKHRGVGTKQRGVGTKPRGVGTKPRGVGTKPHAPLPLTLSGEPAERPISNSASGPPCTCKPGSWLCEKQLVGLCLVDSGPLMLIVSTSVY
eukprot:1156358-Pelagomonas_calceolata.AAC.5